MVLLDTDTVILSSSAISISFGCVLLTFSPPASRLRLHWAAAVILYGVGGGLIGFRAVLPPWLANVIANMLVGASVIAVHRGTQIMLGRRPPDKVYAGAVAALGIIYYIFTYPLPDIQTRLFVVSIFRVPFFVGAAIALFPLRRETGGARVLLWLLGCWSAWYAVRAGLALSSEDWAVQVRTGQLQGVNFLIATSGHLLITAALFRMEAERSVGAMTSHADDLRQRRNQLEQMVRERTAELLTAKNEAERANWAKSHFLAAASHDLRQPLQALRLFMEILSERSRDTPESVLVDKAMAALDSSEILLHALLDISRLDAGVVTVTMEPVRLDEIVGKLVDELAGTAAQKGLSLRALACRYTVMTDRLLLERALRNLLHNAVRYTESGGILVGCRRQAERVRVEIWDTGIGIPKNAQEIIFDDFYQLGNTERDQSKGLGLGLAILRRMATLLGWQVTVRSRVGRGSVFAIAVPQAEAEPPPA